jgi:arginyl-tRNA synthetase
MKPMIREEIEKLTERAIKDLYDKEVKIGIEHPAELSFGDYSTNIAMILKKNPQEIANAIKSPIFEKIEVKNGFINFFISKEYLQNQVKEILEKGEKFGQLNIGKNQKAQIEFISANPTGPLHIGNGRGAFFGDTLANVLEKAGYKITREYYINDAKKSAQIKELGKTALGRGVTYLTKNLEFRIKKLGPKLKKISGENEAGYLLAQEVQKDIKGFIEKKIRIKFDNWISEEELYKKKKVDKIFDWLKKENLSYLKEGAWWVKTSQFGDSQDWVIIRSEAEGGEPTYLLSDTAYHKDKFDRGFNKIINIWGADHQGHVGKMKAVAKMLGFKGDLDILITQVVRLKSGLKLSKRRGQIITLEELIDEIGLDVARFFYLIKSLDTQMEFDLDLAKQQSEKNPVYYVQYAHARICSILRKIKGKISLGNYELLKEPSELELIKQLIRLPEIIEDTARDYQVQRIPQYAIELATIFHQFYRDCHVISEDKELTKARFSLVLATKAVFKNTLNLMGISAPEHM